MRYRKFSGIIIRKQNYKEADQIATVITKEAGKVRVLAKGIRLAKSKLAGSFQDVSLVEFEVARRGGIPIVISSKTLKSFPKLKQDLTKTAAAFYAVELMLKLTADESPNKSAFEELLKFLSELDSKQYPENALYLLIDRYSLRLLNSLGFSVEHVKGSWRLPKELEGMLTKLQDDGAIDENELASGADLKKLHKAVGNFVEYIIERRINSQKFLTLVK